MELSPCPRRRACWLATAWGLAAGLLVVSPALAIDVASEASVKAAYLYKFLAYVEWPAGADGGPDAPHVIAVLNADNVAAELDQLAAGHTTARGQRRLLVRRVVPDEPLDGVHVLHLGRGSRAPDPALLRRLPLLVVTDLPVGLPAYGMLNFVTVDRRVRFEAAPATAEKAGLKLSARLLAVAERVVMP